MSTNFSRCWLMLRRYFFFFGPQIFFRQRVCSTYCFLILHVAEVKDLFSSGDYWLNGTFDIAGNVQICEKVSAGSSSRVCKWLFISFHNFFSNGLCRQTPLQLVKHDAFPPHLNFKCHAKMAQKFKCNKFLHLIFYLAIGICVFVMGLLGQTRMRKKLTLGNAFFA